MWNVIRVAYFDNDKALILLGPIAQVVELISKQSLPVHVTSHWKFGPHIDVLVECDQALFDSEVYPSCAATIQAWLAENPSSTELVPENYEKLSYQLAMSELEPPPYSPLMQNNTVTVGAYQRSQSINIEGFHGTKERFLTHSTPLLFALLKLKKADPNMFFTTLVYMLAATAAQFRPYGLKRGYISFRSHAEFFFEHFDQGNQLRAKFDALDKNYSALIDANIEQVALNQLDAIQLHPGQKTILQNWHQVLNQTFNDNLSVVNENYEAIINEDNEVSSTEQNFATLAESISRDVPEEIDKPSKVYNTGKVVNSAMEHEEGRRLFRSHDFIAYRTTVNYFYLLLPVLDITPIQKFSICHLVANSTERVFNISWKDVIPDAVGGSNE